MGHEVSNLEKARVIGAGEVGDVTEVVERSPSRTKFPKATHPQPCTLMKPTLGEDQEAPLGITLLLELPLEEDVEPLAHFLRGAFDCLLAMQNFVLLHDRGEQSQAATWRLGDDLGYVVQYRITCGIWNLPPESTSSPDCVCVKGLGGKAGETGCLDLV